MHVIVDYFLQLFLMLVLAYSSNYISIFIPHYNVLSFWQLTNITFSIINDSATCCIKYYSYDKISLSPLSMSLINCYKLIYYYDKINNIILKIDLHCVTRVEYWDRFSRIGKRVSGKGDSQIIS